MNKKDLSDLRKEFKLDSYALPIKEVYSVYLKKDNGKIITNELTPFEMMDVETRELYLNNFKKVLTGSIDTKIFELDLKNKDTQSNILDKALNEEDFTAYADTIVDKIRENFNYDSDIVINFIKTDYYKAKRKSNESDPEDYISSFNFILCTINKVDIPKKILKFDYSEMKFKAASALDMPINLNSPLDGFLYPAFGEDYIDLNKIIYYSHKAKQINAVFVKDVLDSVVKATAEEEKESFTLIIQASVKNEIKPELLQEIYESVNEKLKYEEDENESTIDMKEFSNILSKNGVKDKELIKDSFLDICGGDYSFKVKNILPDFDKRSIKIENDNLKIEITPGNLNCLKQIRDKNGRKCLLIALNEEVNIEGMNLKTDTNN